MSVRMSICQVYEKTILFIYNHLFCKYFVRQGIGKATKGKNVKTWKCEISIFCSSCIFLIISNSSATYGCRHPSFCIFCLKFSRE